MYKLVIHTNRDPKFGIPDAVITGDAFEFDRPESAELRALLWLYYCPHDIVMMVELEEDFCKHCHFTIREKEGYVLHRWIHKNSGAYLCHNSFHKQAEPEGVS